MDNLLKVILLGNEKNEFNALIDSLRKTERHYFLRNEILKVFSQLCDTLQKPQYFFSSSTLGELIQRTHEILLDQQNCWLLLRPSPAHQVAYRIELGTGHYSQMKPSELLHRRDRLVNCEDRDTFEINFEPFFNPDLTIEDPRNIGQGFNFLHQYLLSKHSDEKKEWEETLFRIIHQCRYREHSFLIGADISNMQQLQASLEPAYQSLERYSDSDSSDSILQDFTSIGLAPGWGNTIGSCRATLKLLERLIQCPDAPTLEAFLSKIPNVFSIVSVSVHGWVGQENVLGKAETAGQVAYVLDQARSLEKKLIETIELAGLTHLNIQPQVLIVTRLIPDCEGTQCNTKFEDIQGTQFSKILRIPFRDEVGTIVPQWISKFQVWPYLKGFIDEACDELAQLLKDRPDLIIGHYSDGNLVAYRMAKRLKTLHCSIAHSLEKTKHLFGDLYWKELEERFNFSVQFAADLITMNASDFIVTSSQHEIFGTHDTIGQYESYQCFTLPNLFHVVSGVNLKSSRFNVVPPGVDETIFFPNSHRDQRPQSHTQNIESLLFESANNPDIVGQLANPSLRPLLTFAPLQLVKNLTGLVEAFGQHQTLRQHCNLILITGENQIDQAQTSEQQEILEQLHHLIQAYDLDSSLCWIGQHLPSEDLGEIYRVIADRQGLLLHCAHFEAFGLTLLEAMISGLPVFTTKFGGSAEIVAPERTGFLINPTEMQEALDQVLAFVQSNLSDSQRWQSFSDASIHHIHTHYRWSNHVSKLLTLTKIHKYLRQENKDRHAALEQYLEALYRLIYQNDAPRSSCLAPVQVLSDSSAYGAFHEATTGSSEILA